MDERWAMTYFINRGNNPYAIIQILNYLSSQLKSVNLSNVLDIAINNWKSKVFAKNKNYEKTWYRVNGIETLYELNHFVWVV